jgi:hypothetical protein
MYIGEIEEIGVIEPISVPESQPAEADPQPDGVVPLRIEEPVPAR